MTVALPVELLRLLDASGESARETAWTDLITQHSPLLLRVARMHGADHDAALDRYTFILEKLREHDFRRFREFRPSSSCLFTTWLAVVARRLCADHWRTTHGRIRAVPTPMREAEQRLRKGLTVLGGGFDVELLGLPDAAGADDAVLASELKAALDSALHELHPDDRLLLSLRFRDELPVREIAAIMRAASVFRVYRRIDRVLAILRELLQRAGIEGR